mmetsp:Transcript_37601/g.56776  ORF Transcript_37601/g.56776 Transcript_37601/m.56776 type:complete len:101 (-) Transcript_37601:113-415(-)|eukprot:CAMPEP_0194777336 /NCGR_PEP_ID=MMETSP0323_2-20130528/65391_1 /TAXON_ID=2866 ORGANISM="Crypthecodinium cohnii, Strain Seligo" /NCGR_SAMPLE_ID=MMETSP0323_2 /ASSEMBLY_ACC=CAM_ASM_000346 /LENGTH=100 /DNA_ID=CAMNT_0039714101 /DNA_START=290 /DNA_END=592 /DNA_ORIENTATION=-
MTKKATGQEATACRPEERLNDSDSAELHLVRRAPPNHACYKDILEDKLCLDGATVGNFHIGSQTQRTSMWCGPAPHDNNKAVKVEGQETTGRPTKTKSEE